MSALIAALLAWAQQATCSGAANAAQYAECLASL